MLKIFAVIAAVLLVAGCGGEMVGTAATAASAKKQEVEQAKQSMEDAQKKLEQAQAQAAERAAAADKP